MERIQLDRTNVEAAAARAASIIRAGGVVLYPTDTLYGLGADALSDEAVAKIYAIKGRDKMKPIHALVDSIEMAEAYVEVNERLRSLVVELQKGKVTFICKRKMGIDTGICRGIDTFAFRIPDNEFCLTLVRTFGKPVTATSANTAGEQAPRTVDAILAQLGSAAALIDITIDAGDSPAGGVAPLPSTVLDLSTEVPVLLREGAISSEAIQRVIRIHAT